MCGITGAVWSAPAAALPPDVLARMTAVLAHRGPDDTGSYQSAFHQRPGYGAMPGVALGHRRLSIIDVAGGHQPLANEDESVWIVFNGEIYNHRELRMRLEGSGHRFRSHSDTETIVHLYEDEGLDFLRHLNGMFALAIWDANHRRLVLARDRLGEKPLFYRLEADRLLFASELKSLLEVPGLAREIDPQSLDEYLTYQYVPHPRTIFRGISKLPPAHYGVIWLVVVFMLAGIASGVFINHIFPLFTSVPGFRFFAPRFTVVVNRTEQIRVNEGVEIRQLYEQVRASSVTIASYSGPVDLASTSFKEPAVGSGLIVTADGLIFTTKSIVGDPNNTIFVFRHDGSRYAAKVLAFDPKSELAAIKIESRDLPVLDFGSTLNKLVGDKLVGSGASLLALSQPIFVGELTGLPNRVGVLEEESADGVSQYLSVTPGLSSEFLGGSFLDVNHQIAGFYTAAGILPGEYLRAASDNFLKNRTFIWPRFDFSYQSLPVSLSESLGLGTRFGARISEAFGAAARAGLARGDVITAINGNEITDKQTFENLLLGISAGSKVDFTVYKNGQARQVELTTGTLQ